MTQQTNLFQADPELTEITTQVIAVRPHFFGTAIAVDQNIVRAAGGGEPCDVGKVDDQIIKYVEKHEGKTWLAICGDPSLVQIGDKVDIRLDADHRSRRRRLHTGVHMAIRCIQNHLGSVNITEAEISEDALLAFIKGQVDQEISKSDIAEVDSTMRSVVHKQLPIEIRKAKSVDHAEAEYGCHFRVSDRHAFRGRVRLVCIEGFDVNPCSGLHHTSSDIGPFEMKADLQNASKGHFGIKLNLSPTWMYWYGDK